ncbi:hypothetical protein NDU88_004979 [Pleurodeles waltl]|uniref:Uncharacterized protein n=1 Tax=Pleurodeles waltl TaxID=8319 RepID=A0AAV7WTY1_PLEWA|nr:hypothetical protein NDU88_004979 [Pleurodeles waltl]
MQVHADDVDHRIKRVRNKLNWCSEGKNETLPGATAKLCRVLQDSEVCPDTTSCFIVIHEAKRLSRRVL